MIHALTQGKWNRDAVDEDMLTSTVFGVLKHLPASEVLIPLLGHARDEGGQPGGSLHDALTHAAASAGSALTDYTRADVLFWPEHEDQGEPDLLVVVSGQDAKAKPLLMLVEVKLWSGKSRTRNRDDQLCRYLTALHDLRFTDRPLIRDAVPVGMVYLTALDPTADLEGSRSAWRGTRPFRCYQLAWQEVTEVLAERAPTLAEPFNAMALELVGFLRAMTLKTFKGYTPLLLEDVAPLAWEYAPSTVGEEFWGFSQGELTTAPRVQSFYQSNNVGRRRRERT